jgi:hypothetical protein
MFLFRTPEAGNYYKVVAYLERMKLNKTRLIISYSFTDYANVFGEII